MVLAKLTDCKRVVLTDYDEDALELLTQNVADNFQAGIIHQSINQSLSNQDYYYYSLSPCLSNGDDDVYIDSLGNAFEWNIIDLLLDDERKPPCYKLVWGNEASLSELETLSGTPTFDIIVGSVIV